VSAVPEQSHPREGEPLVVADWPPNIEEIRAVLPAVSRSNIFAYAGKIYSPSGTDLPPWLIEHEKVHFQQQKQHGVNLWWKQFLADPLFRLEQEIPAHQREWQVWLQCGKRSRNQKRVTLKSLAKRLSAPMYGNMVSFTAAKLVIKAGT
jgi:hypothetical protein